ncbi:MAG: phage head-tail connector protein [Romboutsia timonensis]
MTLDNVKILLSLTDDDSQDVLLAILMTNAINTILLFLGLDTFPAELSFIAEQMTVVKYRRLGAEGIDTEKIDVLSTKYTSDDLNPFKELLIQYKLNSLGGKRLRML